MKCKLPKDWGKVKGTSAFNPISYSDGSPSRESEEHEDWEMSGIKETEKLFEKCRQDAVSVTSLRDQLNQIHSLLEVCTVALTHQDWKGQIFVQECVAEVLCDFVTPNIEKIEKELEHL